MQSTIFSSSFILLLVHLIKHKHNPDSLSCQYWKRLPFVFLFFSLKKKKIYISLCHKAGVSCHFHAALFATLKLKGGSSALATVNPLSV